MGICIQSKSWEKDERSHEFLVSSFIRKNDSLQDQSKILSTVNLLDQMFEWREITKLSPIFPEITKMPSKICKMPKVTIVQGDEGLDEAKVSFLAIDKLGVIGLRGGYFGNLQKLGAF